MSLPTTLFSTEDIQYMRRALQIAQLADGSQSPNPKVGAVIVHKGRILGESFHAIFGEAHAEVRAVEAVPQKERALLPSSCIYVTLEPCHHHGKTPPCVDLLLKHRFKRVVVACTDPYVKVAGQSLAKLRAAGVSVEHAVLEAEARHTSRRFFTRIQHNRPYIILKYAQSQDGYIGRKDKAVWLTQPLSKRLVHKWRSEEAAILVGSGTACTDNPRLDNRYWGTRQPLRLVLDRAGRCSENLQLFQAQTQLPTWRFTSAPYAQMPFPTRNIPLASPQPLHELLAHLHKAQIGSVLVEGGTRLLEAFMAAQLWDEARIFTATTQRLYTPKHADMLVAAPIQRQVIHKKRMHIGPDTLDFYLNPVAASLP